jgi:ATP-dependent protease ClpP protease subunit
MLIHQLSGGTTGSMAAITEEVKNLQLFMRMIKQIYLEHTTISSNDIDEILRHNVLVLGTRVLGKGYH